MELTSPIIITARLLPGVKIGDGYVSIEYAGASADGRTRYRYHIDLPDCSHTGDDLSSGCQGGSLQSGLESLLSFLSACGESVAYGRRTGRETENAELFPPEIGEWADSNSDELSMLSMELQETPGLIAE